MGKAAGSCCWGHDAHSWSKTTSTVWGFTVVLPAAALNPPCAPQFAGVQDPEAAVCAVALAAPPALSSGAGGACDPQHGGAAPAFCPTSLRGQREAQGCEGDDVWILHRVSPHLYQAPVSRESTEPSNPGFKGPQGPPGPAFPGTSPAYTSWAVRLNLTVPNAGEPAPALAHYPNACLFST